MQFCTTRQFWNLEVTGGETPLSGTSNLPGTFHVKEVAFICILFCIPFAFWPSAGPDPPLASSVPIEYYGAFSTRRWQSWDNPGPSPPHVRCLAPRPLSLLGLHSSQLPPLQVSWQLSKNQYALTGLLSG